VDSPPDEGKTTAWGELFSPGQKRAADLMHQYKAFAHIQLYNNFHKSNYWHVIC